MLSIEKVCLYCIYFDSVVFPNPHKCHGTSIHYIEPKCSAVTTRHSGLSAHRCVRPEVSRQPLNGYVSRFRGIPPLLMASSHAHGDPSSYIIYVLFRNTAFLVTVMMFFFSIDRRCTPGLQSLARDCDRSTGQGLHLNSAALHGMPLNVNSNLL